MGKLWNLIKSQLLILIMSLLLMLQCIFGSEEYYYLFVVLVLQITRMAWKYYGAQQFQMVLIIQYLGYMTVLYLCSNTDVLSCMCVMQIGQTLFFENEFKNRRLIILFSVGADLLVLLLFKNRNTSQIYLPCISIAIKTLSQLINYPQVNEHPNINKENLIVESNHQSIYKMTKDRNCHSESMPTTPKTDLYQVELLSFFPQGIALVALNDDIQFCNENMKKIFVQGENQQSILQAIYNLEEQQIVEQAEKQSMEQPPKQSMSSFSTFQPVPIPKTLFINVARSQNKQSGTVIQKQLKEMPLPRAKTQSKKETIKIEDTFISDSCVIEQEIQCMKKQIQRKEVQNLMKTTHVQEHIVVLGYIRSEKQKRRQIEIKLYSTFMNDCPYILIVARDITHRDYIRSLKNYCNQKSKMLTFVSHEFRTPLNCIIDQLNESLREDCRNASETIFLRIALHTAKQLLNLSDDLLDLAQIRADKFKAVKQKFNLKNMLKSCLELFSATAEKQQIVLTLNYNAHVPKIIEQDSNRIKQIITNLIGNAFKFTAKGNITLEVTQGQDRKRITISVADTGIGISDEDKLKLFKAFAKSNSEESKKMNIQGVGLGLLISNQILQNLNGDTQNGLKVHSQLYKGSTFYFTIQICDVQESFSLHEMEERNQESENSEENSLVVPDDDYPQKLKVITKKINIKASTKVSIADPKILIVDDVQLNVEMIARMIKDTAVDWALNGYQAIQKCKERIEHNQELYKVILMDLEMPIMNGFQVSKAILSLCADLGASTTIIGCSAYDSEEQMQECLKVGMTEYLHKPVKQKALQQILYKYL
ncbi:unnamed protein product (macronuclear) [Paramecium tetraurelia]|uniref:Uncharacterized protein n=1 Tax=Paramecium tetraurelia TaxID=5888 RepID=A0BHX0_PARTE|nr:uncharacterized protein GSPATT00029173001 [Paramecium tetraurelia]CAK58137.1 unnamed protein product [Paramecium tetraurelia]|eukprot:XP_001425535.1 hypothetical protein (macronuclear) [Paramecium tetraurelia strain d4-2]